MRRVDRATPCTGNADCKPIESCGETRCGFEIKDQLQHYDRFDCSQPQICADRVMLPAERAESAQAITPQRLTFALTHCSTGQAPLTISRVVVYGDARCAFAPATLERSQLAPGESTIVSTIYTPTESGRDHAQLRVFSNAENFDPLILSVCGTVGPIDQGGSTSLEIDGPPWHEVCIASESVNPGCHGVE